MISAAEYIKNIIDEKSGNDQEAKFFLIMPRGNKKNFKRSYDQSMYDYILKALYKSEGGCYGYSQIRL